MTVPIQHGFVVAAEELLSTGIAGAVNVVIDHNLGVSRRHSFENVWSRRISLDAMVPQTFDLDALPAQQSTIIKDLNTGQDVRVMAFANAGNALVQIIVRHAADDMLVLPLNAGGSAYFEVSVGTILGQTLDSMQLLALLGPTDVDIFLATQLTE